MKQYKMLSSIYASADANGLTGRTYEQNEILQPKKTWEYDLINSFLDGGWAMELKVTEPTDYARARTEFGHFKADDPTTPDVNEAYVGGVAPKKKRAPRKKTSKKSDG
jgi:hypothetical protein